MKRFEEWFKERKKQHTEISFQETFQAGHDYAMKEVEGRRCEDCCYCSIGKSASETPFYCCAMQIKTTGGFNCKFFIKKKE